MQAHNQGNILSERTTLIKDSLSLHEVENTARNRRGLSGLDEFSDMLGEPAQKRDSLHRATTQSSLMAGEDCSY